MQRTLSSSQKRTTMPRAKTTTSTPTAMKILTTSTSTLALPSRKCMRTQWTDSRGVNQATLKLPTLRSTTVRWRLLECLQARIATINTEVNLVLKAITIASCSTLTTKAPLNLLTLQTSNSSRHLHRKHSRSNSPFISNTVAVKITTKIHRNTMVQITINNSLRWSLNMTKQACNGLITMQVRSNSSRIKVKHLLPLQALLITQEAISKTLSSWNRTSQM